MQAKNKLAMFDLDGTLFDTKDVNYYAYKYALSKYNIELDYDFFCKYCNGKKYSQFISKICNLPKDEIEVVHKIKKEIYSTYLKHAKINIHLFNIIELIRVDYYIALITTASKKNTFEILKYYNKENLFDLVITQDDITNPKPNSECFIKAINYFNIKNDNCIIFEDSEVGIEAAKGCTQNIYVVKGYN